MQDSNLPQANESLIGKLLVASTLMEDAMLSRSVSLVVHHDDQHVFAVLLNRPMKVSGLPTLPSPKAEPGETRPRFSLPPASTETTTEFGDEDDVPPAESKLSLAGQTISEAAGHLGQVHFGGPLSGPVVAVHGESEFAEAEAGHGVYVAAQKELLESLVKTQPGPFRLIVGHLGWTNDQLRREREAGYWHLATAHGEQVFNDDEFLWPSIIRRATSNSVARWLGCEDVPHASLVN
ncbi:MAG: YqgE/AlgH family protein [Planctomycetota bacterium]